MLVMLSVLLMALTPLTLNDCGFILDLTPAQFGYFPSRSSLNGNCWTQALQDLNSQPKTQMFLGGKE